MIWATCLLAHACMFLSADAHVCYHHHMQALSLGQLFLLRHQIDRLVAEKLCQLFL